jgi:2-hydroxychromene-2-carboxylate isomerase
MTKPIEFYFDFASQYGFLAAMQIDALPRPITWRPFLLGAVYKTFGKSPLDHPLKRDYVIRVDAPRMGRRIGLDLGWSAGADLRSAAVGCRAGGLIERGQNGGITIVVPPETFGVGVGDLVAKLKTFRYEGERRVRLIAD